jgi:hypothetical protein
MNHGASELKAGEGPHLSSRLLGLTPPIAKAGLCWTESLMHLLTRVRTDLEQALAQAVWGGALLPFLGLYNQVELCLHFFGSRCLQSIERCGLLANSQSCHPLTTWGSAVTVQSPLGRAFAGTNPGVHARLVILAVLTEGL